MMNVVLLLSILIVETSVLCISFLGLNYVNLSCFFIGVVIYTIWLKIAKIEIYLDNPNKNRPKIFLFRRSSQIKMLTTGIVLLVLLVQIDFFDCWTSEPTKRKLNFRVFEGILSIAVMVHFLILDIMANKKKINAID